MNEEHVHHWRIDTPDGRETVPAVCLTCGATTEFRTGWEDVPLRKRTTIKRQRVA